MDIQIITLYNAQISRNDISCLDDYQISLTQLSSSDCFLLSLANHPHLRRSCCFFLLFQTFICAKISYCCDRHHQQRGNSEHSLDVSTISKQTVADDIQRTQSPNHRRKSTSQLSQCEEPIHFTLNTNIRPYLQPILGLLLSQSPFRISLEFLFEFLERNHVVIYKTEPFDDFKHAHCGKYLTVLFLILQEENSGSQGASFRRKICLPKSSYLLLTGIQLLLLLSALYSQLSESLLPMGLSFWQICKQSLKLDGKLSILIAQFLSFVDNLLVSLKLFLFLVQFFTQLVDPLAQNLAVFLQFRHLASQRGCNLNLVSQGKLLQFSRPHLLVQFSTLNLLHVCSLDTQNLRPRSPFFFGLCQMSSQCLQTLTNHLSRVSRVLFNESLHTHHDHVQSFKHLLAVYRSDGRQQRTLLLFGESDLLRGFEIHD